MLCTRFFYKERFCFRYLEIVLAKCYLSLDLSLGLRMRLNFKYDQENILISGEVGSGKTTVCKILTEYLRSAPYFVHTHSIDCRSLKGDSFDFLNLDSRYGLD